MKQTPTRSRRITARLATPFVLLAALTTANWSDAQPVQGNAASASAAAGQWTETGGLAVGRCQHTATRLLDGRGLVAGGWTGGSARNTLRSSELYDPLAGSWSSTGQLTRGREGQTATLLADGRVLVTGGVISGANQQSAEVYDPRTGTWTSTGLMLSQRYGSTATLLPDGRVLVTGGLYLSPLATSELFDPTTGTWSAGGDLGVPRFNHTATLMADGTVLVVGGTAGWGHPYDENTYFQTASAERYDPGRGAWTRVGNLDQAREFHTASQLPDGRILVAGGFVNMSIPSGQPDPRALASAELFDPGTRIWSATGGLPVPFQNHQATVLPGGNVLVTGPTSSRTSIYDTGRAIWNDNGDRHYAWGCHTQTLLSNGTVLAVGGQTSRGVAIARADLFDPAFGIDSRITGAWYDPAQPGHGLFIEVLSEGRFLAWWFTFNPAGTQQAWFGGVGTYSGNTATIPQVTQSSGGRWIPNFNPAQVVNNAWGSLSFEFTDLDHGRVDFGSVAGYGSGSMNLTRLTRPAMSTANASGASADAITPAFTGAWYDPAQAGHGLFVEVLPDNRVLAWWFTFDPSGTQQAWFGGVGTYSGNTATITAVVQPTGGRWIPNFNPQQVANNPWGTLTLEFSDCANGVARFASTRGYGNGSMNLTRLTVPVGVQCP